MPDFFNGNPAKMEWYPPTNDEQQAALAELFEDALWSIHQPKIPGILQAAEKVSLDIKSWGIIGYCRGAKWLASSRATNQVYSRL